MLTPKKVKYRKWQTARKDMSKVTPDTRGTTVAFGSFGLKATMGGRVRSNQIESARIAITRKIKKAGKLWIRVFPDKPLTRKPAEIESEGEETSYY